MSKIKVVHISQAVGGVETYIRQIAANINSDVFELVIVMTPVAFALKKLCDERGIKYYILPIKREGSILNDIKTLFHFKKIIKKEKPAFVHVHSAKAGFLGRIAAKQLKVRSLFTANGVSYLSFTGFKRIFFYFLELLGKKYTDKILSVSDSETTRLVYELGFDPAIISMVPNSIDIDKSIEKKPATNILYKLEGKINIGTIGRLTPQKNPLLFVDIANDVIKKYGNNVHFYFLGVGEHDHLMNEVKDKISLYKLENSVHLLQRGDANTAEHFLQQLDIFILPSVFEGLPFALLEAMLQRVPCVVSNCDGNADVIYNNVNGFTCMNKNDYTEAIALLINNPLKAKQIGEAGRDHVIEKHDIKKNIVAIENVYRSVAES